MKSAAEYEKVTEDVLEAVRVVQSRETKKKKKKKEKTQSTRTRRRQKEKDEYEWWRCDENYDALFKIAPSLLAAPDPPISSRLDALAARPIGSADVFDGQFVPVVTFGPSGPISSQELHGFLRLPPLLSKPRFLHRQRSRRAPANLLPRSRPDFRQRKKLCEK